MTLVGVVVGTQSFYDWRKADQAAGQVRADHVLTPANGNNALAEELRRRLVGAAGTSDAVGIHMMPISIRMEGRTSGEEPQPRMYGSLATGDLTRVLHLPIRGRPLNALGEREVALSDSAAAAGKVQIGSPVWIRLPGAAKDRVYTVAALYPDTNELSKVVLPAQHRTVEHLPSGRYVAIYVRGPLDREATLQAGATIAAYDKPAYVLRKAAESAENNRLLPYMSALIALFCLVSAINGLCLALLDRRGSSSA
ncbi:hypothetical protein ACFQ0B_78280 [Nonomuraea thailandensis]